MFTVYPNEPPVNFQLVVTNDYFHQKSETFSLTIFAIRPNCEGLIISHLIKSSLVLLGGRVSSHCDCILIDQWIRPIDGFSPINGRQFQRSSRSIAASIERSEKATQYRLCQHYHDSIHVGLESG